MTITLEDPQKEIRILSTKRAQGTPSYFGSFELSEESDGLLLINELDVEDYLTRVVPSEMPSNYELEALKRRQFAHGRMPTGRSRRMHTAVTAHTLMTARTIRCTIIQRAVSGRIWQSRRRTGRLYITTIPRRKRIIFQLPADILPMERSGAPAKTRFRI